MWPRCRRGAGRVAPCGGGAVRRAHPPHGHGAPARRRARRRVQGRPEVVLDESVTDCPAAVRDALTAAARSLADGGLQVLAVAGGPVDSAEDGLRAAGLAPLGLVGIGDPVRPEAASTTAALDTAGIHLVLITGDHPATAAAIAGEVGIATDGVVSFDSGTGLSTTR
ncbi:HAD family hydrolase, partial [Luedemannella flava]